MDFPYDTRCISFYKLIRWKSNVFIQWKSDRTPQLHHVSILVFVGDSHFGTPHEAITRSFRR